VHALKHDVEMLKEQQASGRNDSHLQALKQDVQMLRQQHETEFKHGVSQLKTEMQSSPRSTSGTTSGRTSPTCRPSSRTCGAK